MAFLSINVDTPNKSYQGHITLAANSSIEDAKEAMKALIGGINSIESLCVESDNSAIIFSKNVIAESVITVKVMG